MPEPTWDVFVSYVHGADEVPARAPRGWVTTLADELRKILRRKLNGERPRIFMDHQLAGNQGLTESLRAAIRASRTFVLVMSPGYQQSRWCQWELVSFLADEAERMAKNNVFLVETDPIDRNGLHPALADLLSFRFWDREFEDNAPRLLGYPEPPADPKEDRYWPKVNELAHLIDEQLKQGDPVERSPQPVVWLAEVTDDLRGERDHVAGALRQQGYRVTPEAPYPREREAAYLQALRGDLDLAELYVQLLGPVEGELPTWGAASFVALQAREAAITARVHRVELLQWRPRAMDPAAALKGDYRNLLVGPQVQATGLESFRQEILKRLEAQRLRSGLPSTTSHTSVKAASPAASSDLHVYITADAVDRELAQRVHESLKDLDVSSVLSPVPPPGFSPHQIRQAQQDCLEASDGVVLVYGLAPVTWVHSQFAFARRTLVQQQRRLWVALVDGPPAEKPEPGLLGPGIFALNCRTGFDPGLLLSFVATLRAGGAHA